MKALIFWIVVGVVLSAIFAPGLLAVIGMWSLLIILPVLGLLIRDLFSSDDEVESPNVTREKSSQGDGSKISAMPVDIKGEKESLHGKNAKNSPVATKSDLRIKSDVAMDGAKKRLDDIRRNMTSAMAASQEEFSIFEIRGLRKNGVTPLELSEMPICSLKREPDNEYDKNAIQVVLPDGYIIAYVAKEVAKYLAPKIDAGKSYNVQILPETYNDSSWGICSVKIVEKTSEAVDRNLDLRLSRQIDVGWLLNSDGVNGGIVDVNGVMYYIVSCGEGLSKKLGFSWNGEELKIGARLTTEFANRLKDNLAVSDLTTVATQIGFKSVKAFSCPQKIGSVTLCAEICTLQFIKVGEVVVKTVDIPGLKRGMVYHMTAIENLEKIFDYGLLSNHEAVSKGFLQKDVSEGSIQRIRETKKVYGKSLHEYVPFYINPRNAMLYRVSRENNIVVIGVKSDSFAGLDYVLSNRNAAVKTAAFGNSQNFIENMWWDEIFSDNWNEDRNLKEITQSEVLVPSRVAQQDIAVIHCRNSITYLQVAALCKEKGLLPKIEVSPALFFD